MTDVAGILQLMQAFVERRVGPEEFVAQYMKQWKDRAEAQDTTIADHPEIDGAMRRLRDELRSGRISADDFESQVARQWTLLGDTALRPGSTLDRALGHIFVEADAFVSDTDDRDTDAFPPGLFVTADELREEVRQALATLGEDDSTTTIPSSNEVPK